MKALVLGGYGAVGAPVVRELRAYGDTAVAAGRDPSRADRVVDLTDPGSFQAALDGVDVVVNAAGVEDPSLVSLATGAGAAFVDVTATGRYVAAVERLEPAAPVLLSVGLAPGLTNLLAVAVHQAGSGAVDIAVVLGAGDAHGHAATEWSYQLLGRHFTDPATGTPVRNYTRGQVFTLPGLGRRRLYRTDFSDQHTLTRDLGVPVRTYFGLDSRLGTGALAVLTWVPGARRLPHNAPIPGSDGWLMLAQDAGGTRRWVRGRAQS
ncbi:MAG: NAD-dependent epimerase/dehydratase family protein, partial [Micromonosporaceae bacterium]